MFRPHVYETDPRVRKYTVPVRCEKTESGINLDLEILEGIEIVE